MVKDMTRRSLPALVLASLAVSYSPSHADELKRFDNSQGPLRYIDRYGIPGQGPVPRVEDAAPATSQPGQPAASPDFGPASAGQGQPGAAGAADEGKGEGEKGEKEKSEKEKGEKSEKGDKGEKDGSARTGAGEGKDREGKDRQGKGGNQADKKGKGGENEGKGRADGAPVYDPVRAALFELSSKRPAGALAHIERAVAKNPRDARAHYIRAVVLVELRRYSEASAEYRQVKRLAAGSELAQRAEAGLKNLSP